MRNSGPTFQSPSTKAVKHDISNLLVEFMMINKYGILDEYPWRKGQPLAQEWGEVCKIVRRLLKTLKISAPKLAWYIHSQNVIELDYKEFGLVRWKINKIFPAVDLIGLACKYRASIERERSKLKADARLSHITSYVPKQQSIRKRRTLTDVIEELEHE